MSRSVWSEIALFTILAILPVIDPLLPGSLSFTSLIPPLLIWAFVALGLTVVTGLAGILNLGVAGFMAIGAYTFAILSCQIYPFQLGFFTSLLGATIAGGLTGILLALPTIRLRGDYLAIVTLGFGEIVQDVLRNVDVITKGTQGINPLPPPVLFGREYPATEYLPWYYGLLVLLVLCTIALERIKQSHIGRAWMSARDDELAASCMGISALKVKVSSLTCCGLLAGLGGGLLAGYLGSTGEPSNFDFQVSVMALSMIIVGGLGSIAGATFGAIVMMGINSIVIVKLAEAFAAGGSTSSNVFASAANWKYLVFGLALVLVVQWKHRSRGHVK